MPIVFYLSCVMLSAFSEDSFSLRTRRLRLLESQTDKEISKLGFTDPADTDVPNVETKLEVLLTNFSSEKKIQVQLGSFLYGRTIQKLVVGPEGAPTIIELNSNEGILGNFRVNCKARHSATPERVQIECTHLVAPSGKTFQTKAVVTDKNGSLGLKAQVLSQKGLLVAGAIGTGFLSGTAAALQPDQYSQSQSLGFQKAPSARNLILQGVAQSSLDQSKRLIEQATNEKPILILNPQTPVALYFEEEVRF